MPDASKTAKTAQDIDTTFKAKIIPDSNSGWRCVIGGAVDGEPVDAYGVEAASWPARGETSCRRRAR